MDGERPAGVSIRPYAVDRDEGGAYRLWQVALGATWPLSQAVFHRITADPAAYQPGDHLIAERGGELVGMVATQAVRTPGEPRPRGGVLALLVAPAWRRQGIGRALLAQGVAHLRRRGVTRVQLGGGARSYFWPGVPLDLPDAVAFFAACGWPEVERSFDLVLPLRDVRQPAGIDEALVRQRVQIAPATPWQMPAILAFERRQFPQWLPFFEQPAAHGACTDVLAASGPDGAVLGTALLLDPRAAWRERPFTWAAILGADTGGIGALGVAESWRGRGIGLALAARVTASLLERGTATSYVGWTWLVDWYGRLGYRPWREYWMSWLGIEMLRA